MSHSTDWIDLARYGLEIVVASFEDTPDHRAVAIRGEGKLTGHQEAMLREIGFRKLPSGRTLWARPGHSFRLSELREVFPNLVVRPMERLEFRVSIRGGSPFLSSPPTPSPDISRDRSPEPLAFPVLKTPALTRPPVTDSKPVSGDKSGVPDIKPAPVAKPFLMPKVPKSAAEEFDLPAVPLESLDDELSAEEFEKVNEFQVRYSPKSSIGKPIATIPVNLAQATTKALDRLEDKHGNIDEWVAGELGWTQEEMAHYLSPEQVDAVGLAIEAATRGKGFILADQTGLGKGRVLAALLRWSVLRNGHAVFLTEKANLFSDIWRDICDIGSEDIFGKPLLMNDRSNIIDQISGEVLFESPKKKEMDAVLDARQLPDGCHLMLATYSQFNRRGSKKAKFLDSVCNGKHLFLDECHNIVGESNTRSNFDLVLQNANAVTFSSATFARNALNMGAYRPVFPDSIASLDLVEVLKSGGAAMLEALSQNLAEEGLLLRREHDLSNISIEVVSDTARADLHRQLSDRMSPILSSLARIAMRVSDLAEDMDSRKVNPKERWYAANFGSRLSGVVAQFLTALQVDHCVELCAEALKKGEKPVVVIENTMESLMRELLEDVEEDAPFPEGRRRREALLEQAEAPTFRAALDLMLDRILQISRKVPGQDAEKFPVEDPDILRDAERVRAAIAEFPHLSLSPIDDIQERLEAEGRRLYEMGEIERPWVVGEISARNIRVSEGRYVPVEEQDRNITISAFNNGSLDALVATRAASTGLSLHAHEKVADQRRRVMIELQIPSNVIARQQFWGRVNRRGQVCEPRFLCLTTELPYQVRILANQNAKIAELSANVTGNAESALTMDIPDIINDIGDEVCRRILEDTPMLARRMCIAMQVSQDDYEQEHYFVNKLLSRLVLIPSHQQERLYQRVLDDYEAQLKELAARGRSPKQARVMEGQWVPVSRHLFDPGVPEDGAVFGRPVYLTTIRRTRMARPLQGDDIRTLVLKAREKHDNAYGSCRPGEMTRRHLDALKEVRKTHLKSLVTKDYPNVAAALRATKDNPVKRMHARLVMIEDFLKRLGSGAGIRLTGEEEESVSAVIVDFTLPDLSEVHVPSSYSLRYVLPGDEKPREIALSALLKDSRFGWDGHAPKSESEVAGLRLQKFDAAPTGEVVETRRVLDGNLFSATRLSKLANVGTVVTYEDVDGHQRRGVLIPQRQQDRLRSITGVTRSPAVALAVLRGGGERLSTDLINDENNLVIHYRGNHVDVWIPAKKRAEKNLLTKKLLEITGEFSGDWRGKSARVPVSKLEPLLKQLIDDGHTLHYDGKHRNLAISAVLERPEEPTPEADHAPSLVI